MTAIPTARRESDALAGLASRLVSALAVVLALWLFSEVVGLPEVLWWPLGAWAVGFVLSFALPQSRELFASISGTVVGMLVVALLALAYVVLAAATQAPLDLPPHVFLLAVVPIGLDWHLVVRLRARVLASGFAVILLVGLDGSGVWATSSDGGRAAGGHGLVRGGPGRAVAAAPRPDRRAPATGAAGWAARPGEPPRRQGTSSSSPSSRPSSPW